MRDLPGAVPRECIQGHLTPPSTLAVDLSVDAQDVNVDFTGLVAIIALNVYFEEAIRRSPKYSSMVIGVQ